MTAASNPQEQRLSERNSKPAVALTIVTSVAADVGDATIDAPENSASKRLTTPKMKWMLRWTQQLQETAGTEAQDDAVAPLAATTNAKEPQIQLDQQQKSNPRLQSNEELRTTTPPSHVTDTALAPIVVKTPAPTAPLENRDGSAEDGEVVSDAEPGEVKAAARRQPRNVSSSGAVQQESTPATMAGELRVTMPPAVESSSLSPPMERASPTAASASISPSAKVKEVDGVAVRSHTPSPAKMMLDETEPEQSPVGEVPDKPTMSTRLHGSEAATEERQQNDPVPLEKLPSKRKPQETPTTSTEATDPTAQLSESERQRLERRKRRKSNWDVGDPRKHGGSIDLAALNLLSSTSTPATHPASFAKFPRQRPAYRHSQSLDSKDPPFQRRASFSSGLSYSSPPSGLASPALSASFAQSPPVASSLPPVAPPGPRRVLTHANSMPPTSSTRPGSSRFSANGGYR